MVGNSFKWFGDQLGPLELSDCDSKILLKIYALTILNKYFSLDQNKFIEVDDLWNRIIDKNWVIQEQMR